MFQPVQQVSILATIHFRSASGAKALTVEDVKHDSENEEELPNYSLRRLLTSLWK